MCCGEVLLTVPSPPPPSPSRSRHPIQPQSHGRVTGLLLALRCFLAGFGVLSYGVVTPLPSTLVYLAAGLIWLGLVLVYLPFRAQWLNRLQCGLAAVFISASVSGLFALAIDPTSSSAGYVFFFMLPTTFWGGWSLAASRFRSVGEARELPSSPFFVELKLRYLIRKGVVAVSGSGVTGKPPINSHVGEFNSTSQNKKHTKFEGEAKEYGAYSDAATAAVAATVAAALVAFPASSMMELFAGESGGWDGGTCEGCMTTGCLT